MKNAFRAILLVFAILVSLLFLDAFWFTVVSPDLSYLPRDRRARDDIEAFAESRLQKLPIEAEFESRFAFFDLGKEPPEAFDAPRVIAAEWKMEHSYRLGTFFYVHYALVLMEDGNIVRWYGNQREYDEVLSNASCNQKVLSVENFFNKADNRSDAIKEVKTFAEVNKLIGV